MASEEDIYDEIETRFAKTGGPAFPMARMSPADQEGMTLRDWFAGQFLAGSASTANEPLDVKDAADQYDVDCALHEYWGYTARAAYIAADAMIAARKAGA